MCMRVFPVNGFDVPRLLFTNKIFVFALHQNQIEFKTQNQDDTGQIQPQHQNHNGTDRTIQRIVLTDVRDIKGKNDCADNPRHQREQRARQRISELHDAVRAQITQNQDKQEHEADGNEKSPPSPKPCQLFRQADAEIFKHQQANRTTKNPQNKGKDNRKNQTCRCQNLKNQLTDAAAPIRYLINPIHRMHERTHRAAHKINA